MASTRKFIRVPILSVSRTRQPHRLTAFLPTATQKAHFTSSRNLRSLAPPLNIPKWLKDNSHLLKPPINNHCVHTHPLTVMIVGGPNARTDYHINATPEWFYQYKGSMLLRVVDDESTLSAETEYRSRNKQEASEKFKDIYIHEGEMFLLPANIPHNPVRFEDTVGIVIEQPRPAGSKDKLRWYCGDCREVVYEDRFECVDLGSQIKDAVVAFGEREDLRTCKRCGGVCGTRPRAEEMEKMRAGAYA